MKTAKTTTFVHHNAIFTIDRKQLSRVSQAAKKDRLGRARICLHRTQDEPVQEMIIAFARGTYVRPHRHRKKTEANIILEGEALVVFFDDRGGIRQKIRLSRTDADRPFLYRIAPGVWHTLIPITEVAVIYETTRGPFRKDGSEFATWSPDEEDAAGIQTFLQHLTRERHIR